MSRQTISNWENNKTLPDVALARSISEAYGVSVDQLVNEHQFQTQTVIQEAEPSTQIHTDRIIIRTLFLVYLVGWMLCVLYFWILGGGGGIFFAAIIIGVLFPAITLFISVLLGLFDCSPVHRFFFIFAFALMHMLLPYMTFSLANMISAKHFLFPFIDQFFVGLCVSAVGILLGFLVRWISVLFAKILP